MFEEDPRTHLYRNRNTGAIFTAFAGNAYMWDGHGPRTFTVIRRILDGCLFIVDLDKFMGRNGQFEIVSKRELLGMSARSAFSKEETGHADAAQD